MKSNVFLQFKNYVYVRNFLDFIRNNSKLKATQGEFFVLDVIVENVTPEQLQIITEYVKDGATIHPDFQMHPAGATD